jgi:hypothetical protein
MTLYNWVLEGMVNNREVFAHYNLDYPTPFWKQLKNTLKGWVDVVDTTTLKGTVIVTYRDDAGFVQVLESPVGFTSEPLQCLKAEKETISQMVDSIVSAIEEEVMKQVLPTKVDLTKIHPAIVSTVEFKGEKPFFDKSTDSYMWIWSDEEGVSFNPYTGRIGVCPGSDCAEELKDALIAAYEKETGRSIGGNNVEAGSSFLGC